VHRGSKSRDQLRNGWSPGRSLDLLLEGVDVAAGQDILLVQAITVAIDSLTTRD